MEQRNYRFFDSFQNRNQKRNILSVQLWNSLDLSSLKDLKHCLKTINNLQNCRVLNRLIYLLCMAMYGFIFLFINFLYLYSDNPNSTNKVCMHVC